MAVERYFAHFTQSGELQVGAASCGDAVAGDFDRDFVDRYARVIADTRIGVLRPGVEAVEAHFGRGAPLFIEFDCEGACEFYRCRNAGYTGRAHRCVRQLDFDAPRDEKFDFRFTVGSGAEWLRGVQAGGSAVRCRGVGRGAFATGDVEPFFPGEQNEDIGIGSERYGYDGAFALLSVDGGRGGGAGFCIPERGRAPLHVE